MTLKSTDSVTSRGLETLDRQTEQTGRLETAGGRNKTEPYAGGNLPVEVYQEDTQRDFVWRGLYKHAEAAGLPHEEAVKFANNWAADNLMHQANGETRAYTAKEFAALKQEGATGFDLNERYSPQVLSDLQQRQAAYQISQNEPNAAPLNTPSMSAPQYNDAEQSVNWLTGAITSVTGEDGEVGKQFNRLSVSSLRLLGQLGELQNRATETNIAESGLSQLPNFEGVDYRGVDFDNLPEVLNKYKVGQTITEDAFTSSSVTKNASFRKDTLMIIQSKSGKDVSVLSDYPKQKEILFNPNTKFKVESIIRDPNTGKRVINLKEIE